MSIGQFFDQRHFYPIDDDVNYSIDEGDESLEPFNGKITRSWIGCSTYSGGPYEISDWDDLK